MTNMAFPLMSLSFEVLAKLWNPPKTSNNECVSQAQADWHVTHMIWARKTITETMCIDRFQQKKLIQSAGYAGFGGAT